MVYDVPGVRHRPVALESGMAAGTEVIPFDHRFRRSCLPQVHCISDDPNGFFAANLTDDNTDPFRRLRIRRRHDPPDSVRALQRSDTDIHPYYHQACDFAPEGIYTLIDATVTAPPGTAHEAFFDPATTTAGVGYLATTSTTTGVLQPAAFSQREQVELSTITGLDLARRPGGADAGPVRAARRLDGFSFIETDGTVGLCVLPRWTRPEDLDRPDG